MEGHSVRGSAWTFGIRGHPTSRRTAAPLQAAGARRLEPGKDSTRVAIVRRNARDTIVNDVADRSSERRSGGHAAAPVPLVGFWALGATLSVFVFVVIRAPLAAYTLSLAVFGLPHVLSELRYVDRRFGRRFDPRPIRNILALTAVIVAIRAATVFHLLSAWTGLYCELGGVAALALLCARDAPRRRTTALATAGAMALGAALAPYGTAIALSILHNLTPLGFLWQIAPLPHRRRLMAAAATIFLAAPILTATGWPRQALEFAFGRQVAPDPLKAGSLAEQLYVYVPPAFLTSPHAADIFSASVVAQGAHYAAVLVLLPWLLRRLDPLSSGLVPWPRGRWFAACCVAAGALALARFEQGFAQARALYGIAASLHAWLEIPVLILALTSTRQPPIINSTDDQPELGANDGHDGVARAASIRKRAVMGLAKS